MVCALKEEPVNRVNTRRSVAALRDVMASHNLDAYFIPYEDQHVVSEKCCLSSINYKYLEAVNKL